MKTTYTRTLMVPDLSKAKVRLMIFKLNKYENYGQEPEEIEFTGLKSWTIVEGGAEAEAVETIMDEVDDNHEYLILQFENGRNEFYRNSYVTMFIW